MSDTPLNFHLKQNSITEPSVLEWSYHQTLKLPHLRPSTYSLHSLQPCTSWGSWGVIHFGPERSQSFGEDSPFTGYEYGLLSPSDGNLMPLPLAPMDPCLTHKEPSPTVSLSLPTRSPKYFFLQSLKKINMSWSCLLDLKQIYRVSQLVSLSLGISHR